TFLADLCHLKLRLPDTETAAHRQAGKVEALHDQVLPEGSKGHIRAFLAKGFYFFQGKEAHLPVPAAAVGVALDPPVYFQICFRHFCLLCASFLTDTYPSDNSHSLSLSFLIIINIVSFSLLSPYFYACFRTAAFFLHASFAIAFSNKYHPPMDTIFLSSVMASLRSKQWACGLSQMARASRLFNSFFLSLLFSIERDFPVSRPAFPIVLFSLIVLFSSPSGSLPRSACRRSTDVP